MNPEIKILLIRAGIKQTEIAKALDVTPTAIYQILSGNQRSKRILQYTAKRLQITPGDLEKLIDGQELAA